MEALASYIRFSVNTKMGHAVSWLSLATVLICAVVVFNRYTFQTGFVWMAAALRVDI